jgi:hypothetical protein
MHRKQYRGKTKKETNIKINKERKKKQTRKKQSKQE